MFYGWCVQLGTKEIGSYTRKSSMKLNDLIALTLLACKCIVVFVSDNKKIKYIRDYFHSKSD